MLFSLGIIVEETVHAYITNFDASNDYVDGQCVRTSYCVRCKYASTLSTLDTEYCVIVSMWTFFSWEEDPNSFLCPFEVGGTCKDPDCKYLHPKIPSEQWHKHRRSHAKTHCHTHRHKRQTNPHNLLSSFLSSLPPKAKGVSDDM